MRTLFTASMALAAIVLGSAYLVGHEAGGRVEAAAAPETLEITIDNFTFGRDTVTVERGTTITWLNRDDMPHTVAASDKSFESQALDTGDRFSHTFDKPGTYSYFCSLHPRMTGKVVVR